MHPKTIWQFSTAARIRFGRGSRYLLSECLGRYRVKRPLIITDKTLLSQPSVIGTIDSIKHHVELELFDGGMAEPAIEVAQAACELARNHAADGVIGIGGGSNMDVAKMVAAVIAHHGAPSDYFGFDAIPGPVVPIFALPTTAGTGSEVSH